MMTSKQEAALRLALEALKGGLWDYGPGQDEHERCNEVIAICEEALAEQPAEYISESETEELLELNNLPEPLRLAAMLEKTMQWPLHGKAADCLRKMYAAIEQPAQQEPVTLENVYETIIHWDEGGGKRSRRELARRIVALHTSPPASKPLTDEEIDDILDAESRKPDFKGSWNMFDFARAIEAKLREKNA